MGETKLVAHRGWSMKAPENTIAAFELAGEGDFFGVECDVRCTKDGKWVVHHDETIDRMTNGTGALKDMSYSEVQEVTIDAGYNVSSFPELKIPLLEDVLSICKRSGHHLYLEIKGYNQDDNLSILMEIVNESGMLDKCSIISFEREDLRKIRGLNDRINLGLIISKRPKLQDMELIKSISPAFLNCSYKVLKPSDIAVYHKAGIEVATWTINRQQVADVFIRAGIDYIASDTQLTIG